MKEQKDTINISLLVKAIENYKRTADVNLAETVTMDDYHYYKGQSEALKIVLDCLKAIAPK